MNSKQSREAILLDLARFIVGDLTILRSGKLLDQFSNVPSALRRRFNGIKNSIRVHSHVDISYLEDLLRGNDDLLKMLRIIVAAESNFDPNAVNPASGARGHLQIIPSTERALVKIGMVQLGASNTSLSRAYLTDLIPQVDALVDKKRLGDTAVGRMITILSDSELTNSEIKALTMMMLQRSGYSVASQPALASIITRALLFLGGI
jgi:hypothetical protein